jgi:hypothetical protein
MQSLHLKQFLDLLQTVQEQTVSPHGRIMSFLPLAFKSSVRASCGRTFFRQGALMPLSLSLPEVRLQQTKVQHDGQICYSSVEARQAPQEVWRAADVALAPVLEGLPSGTWAEGAYVGSHLAFIHPCSTPSLHFSFVSMTKCLIPCIPTHV